MVGGGGGGVCWGDIIIIEKAAEYIATHWEENWSKLIKSAFWNNLNLSALTVFRFSVAFYKVLFFFKSFFFFLTSFVVHIQRTEMILCTPALMNHAIYTAVLPVWPKSAAVRLALPADIQLHSKHTVTTVACRVMGSDKRCSLASCGTNANHSHVWDLATSVCVWHGLCGLTDSCSWAAKETLELNRTKTYYIIYLQCFG